ncbi:MAG: 23S rRNA (uracil(1939)-C(5))-methyltransferase RlmD [Moorea sp. SIO2B7]|nr:23S rRNA (uracil(1939)-C(5))-methyltransferase RlmD [Moorena sp. SIO2B7]
MWQQGKLVEIEITDLSNSGDGVGKLDGRVIFVPDTVSGDRALVRLVRVKPQYAHGKLQKLLQPSCHRIRPRCIVADKCGGCQWQHIDDHYQGIAKRDQVIQTLQRIGGFSQPNVAPILSTVSSLGYRNKATYPLSISSTGQVQAGYYRKGTHQLVNLNQCPVQDPRLNSLLAEIKQDIQHRSWSIYNEKRHQGQLRHLSLRIGRRTGEILLTLITTDCHLIGIEEQAQAWLKCYPQLVGVCLNHNPKRTNVIFGSDTHCIAGQPYVTEIFAELQFQLRPDTFFQVNTEAAEALLQIITERLDLQGKEVLLDAYCGIGTFTLPLAKRVKQAMGIEVQKASIKQAQINAQINNITNVSFKVGAVETLIAQLSIIPDLVLLDPPRKGCDRLVIETLLKIKPAIIVYISCKPATLARDLKLFCQTGIYKLTCIQPADLFPQTAHVECAAFLQH